MQFEENNNARAVTALIGALGAPITNEVRIGAIEGLGRAGGATALTHLITLLATPMTNEVRAACLRAVGEAGRTI
jgi:HEAT repeat protein